MKKTIAEPIASYSFNHLRPSSAVRNSGESRFFSIALSTSTSIFCHSFVQYQPCVGSMSFLGFKII